ncbi:hypothetical protein JW711_04320 [Candidatus Woesearchaeota archaeon]|nr:hypothetical protein [Candidatus Woesearchaeota archaeon]
MKAIDDYVLLNRSLSETECVVDTSSERYLTPQQTKVAGDLSTPMPGWAFSIDEFLKKDTSNSRVGLKSGQRSGLDYILISDDNDLPAEIALRTISNLPSQYLKVLRKAGAKLMIVPDASYLPDRLKERHDATLRSYGVKCFCGIQIQIEEYLPEEKVNYAIAFLNCNGSDFVLMHELGHIIDRFMGDACLPKGLAGGAARKLSEFSTWTEIYCDYIFVAGKGEGCGDKEPNGIMKSTEGFANAFSEYYTSKDSNEKMKRENPKYYNYFADLEESAYQCLVERN